jgi:hypothetical protein
MHAMQMTPLRFAALAVLAATLLACSAENVKKGLVLGPDCTSVQAEPFEDTASWFYTYSQQPKPSLVDWANNRSVEFVPMIGWQFVEFVNGTRCSLGASKSDACSVSDIVQSLQEGIDQLHVRPKYLLGFNEPYNHALSGGDVADLWRRYIQPAAESAQLQLVSATATAGGDGLDVLKFFLMRCWDFRNDTSSPCDVQKISAFAIHSYECRERVWEENFNPSGGIFRSSLVKALGGYGGHDWAGFVNSRPLWITETNCNWDGDTPGSKEQCQRISGRGAKEFGQGSIRTLNQLESVDRYAWWNTFQSNTTRAMTLNARLVDANGTLTPVGRAYKNVYETTPC